MSSKSKTKGNNFERDVAKQLTEIYGKTFTRVPNSGAFVGGLNSARKENLSETQTKIYKGDLIPPDDFPCLVLECKFYKDFPFHFLPQGKDIILLDEWIKQVRECCDIDDFWVIWLKVNRKGEYIIWEKLLNSPKWITTNVNYKNEDGHYYFMGKDEFFKYNKQLFKEESSNS